MQRKIRWIDDGFNNAPYNMAIDEVLFRLFQIETQYAAIVRTYGFTDGAMTFGVCQQVKDDSAMKDRLKHSTSYTRRITGGGAVEHTNDIVYSVITHVREHEAFSNVNTSYHFLHSIIHKAIKPHVREVELCSLRDASFMGRKQCFSNPVENDIMVRGQKVAGAAQKRRHGYILHQGSVQLEKLGDKKLNDNDIRASLARSLGTLLQSQVLSEKLTIEEREKAEELTETKYSQEKWIYKY